MFRANGEFVRSIGVVGDALGHGKLEGPQGLALDDEGRLWVTDITSGRVLLYK